jgi:hypothetical protein
MPDRPIKTIAFDHGSRALIVQRGDGWYSYQMQFLREVNGQMEWSPPGPHVGAYDSADTAEREAIARKATRLN